ncbi:Ada metal-binding domain-containing protein [Micromonospora sp. NPDC005299]|uniref:Ada metal-binding domain-containing protein n=1 Tax=Micromonospora sp. NPDC005299 TaxID=3364231 RepID=UPI0036AFD50F
MSRQDPPTGPVDFHPRAASAQFAGYRACKRCSPDAAPPTRPAPGQSTLVGRAGALIDAGAAGSWRGETARRGPGRGIGSWFDCCLTWSLAVIDLRAARTRRDQPDHDD